MTDGERIAAALALSLAFHWLVLHDMGSAANDAVSGEALVVDLAPPEAALGLAAPLTLEDEAPREHRKTRADRRRKALAAYLEAVSDAVHARRMRAGARGAAGNARFALTVDTDGAFARIRLLHGSGNAALDRDAEHAVRAASGAVPRPAILGTAPLEMTLRVKYQFGL